MTPFLFIFGLAVFLFAMRNLEQGIRTASGQRLKNWIAHRTNTPLSSAGSGVVVTAILQSSSMVSLIALAFVSAGIIPLYNGIGVVLGANVGTTVTGWVVTVIGFKMNLKALVIPFMGVGAACNLGYFKDPRITGTGQAIFGFGLLVLGLDVMKDSVTGFSDVYDVSGLAGMPGWIYLLSGVVLAAIMQSSSSVMIITLSLLNSEMLHLTDAAALVIGADLGTTSTTILGSLGQSIIKKQLAAAHVVFNVCVNSLAFLLLLPLLPWALEAFSVTDTMFGLVLFHSTFNLFGLLLFLPILGPYTRWIQSVLPAATDPRKEFFSVPMEVPEAALDSLKAALRHLQSDAVHLNLSELALTPDQVDLEAGLPAAVEGTFEDRYEGLKTFETDFVRFAHKLQLQELDDVQGRQIPRLLEAARAMVYASKTLKDVRADLALMSEAPEQSLGRRLAVLHREFLLDFYPQFISLLFKQHQNDYLAEQITLLGDKNTGHHQYANDLITEFLHHRSDDAQYVSTWYNFNHELHHYIRYLLSALLLKRENPV